MGVGRVDVLEGDDVVAREKPGLGLEDRELGPGRADLRLPPGAPGDAGPDTAADAPDAGRVRDATSPRCSLAFWIAA